MHSIIYERPVHYYETDKMNCVHHSNYIRWFEEARTAWLENIGFGYAKMESMGIMTPVLSVDVQYLSMTRFGEEVAIEVSMSAYKSTKVEFSYRITDQKTGTLRCTGKTQHCFLNALGHPVSLKKAIPELHEICLSMQNERAV